MLPRHQYITDCGCDRPFYFLTIHPCQSDWQEPALILQVSTLGRAEHKPSVVSRLTCTCRQGDCLKFLQIQYCVKIDIFLTDTIQINKMFRLGQCWRLLALRLGNYLVIPACILSLSYLPFPCAMFCFCKSLYLFYKGPGSHTIASAHPPYNYVISSL